MHTRDYFRYLKNEHVYFLNKLHDKINLEDLKRVQSIHIYITDFRMYVGVNVLLDTFGCIIEVFNIKIMILILTKE